MSNISIIGTGYVGLSAAVCFASRGYQVIASTRSADKITQIRAQKAPFYEPALERMLSQTVESGSLKVVSDRAEAILRSDMTFISVATPNHADGSINLTYVNEACEEVGDALCDKKGYHLVVVKSTVVPGTTHAVLRPILEHAANKTAGDGFGLCVNPEFLRQGSSVHDTLHPDRVVIGEYDARSGKQLHELYDDFYSGAVPIMRMSLASAEMVKYASNSFLAMKVSYANEIAGVCERVPGVDITEVMDGVGVDPRINRKFLNAGPGFGGSCFPKDVSALMRFAESRGCTTSLLRAVLDVNTAQALHVAEQALTALGTVSGKRVALLGLAFKPQTDDTREAPALKIARKLMDAGADVCAYDPVVVKADVPGFGTLHSTRSIDECLRDADCCIIVTEWDQFKALTPGDFTRQMAAPVVIDARRIFDPVTFRSKLTYIAVGLYAPESTPRMTHTLLS
ncbi:MAG: UDP-glucose dehydrogenase family protein [Halobacteriota archaeon]